MKASECFCSPLTNQEPASPKVSDKDRVNHMADLVTPIRPKKGGNMKRFNEMEWVLGGGAHFPFL
jgi:hypothetical protein